MKRTVLIMLSFSLLFSLSSSLHHDQETEKQQEEWQKEKNAKLLIFGEESYEDLVSSEHGKLRILKPFAELSPMLQGITNYRLGWFEAEPLTFLVPTHTNADSVFYVVEGEGAIALLHEGNRESHVIEKGDIMRVWAGSIMYLINKSKNQKLKLARLLRPVGNTASFQVFQSAGSEEAESYFRGFSTEIAEAALNTPREQLHQLFGHQSRAAITKAPEEKIRAIAQQAYESETRPWPFRRSNKPFNLLNKQPMYKNNRGKLLEADRNDYEQLRDLNVRVTFTNISRGSMLAPFFNTRAFKLAVVTKGSGYVEIIYPEEKEWHKEDEPQRQTEERYTRVSSPLSQGSVMVSPPGHPTSIVASKEQSLQMVCFEIQAESNEMVFIAGKNNMLSELEKEAKELAFGVAAKVVDEVLRGREEEVFMAGPWEGKGGEKLVRPLMESVVSFVEGV
ncbi:globulin-1 S allele [Phalaenopsis equestris]|uniref:globulin-1 S allele n=1 Tax=Phalaenopsis equestris TaxID=78828 RepID=UPI0009E6505A|nr:globulin-1 S allele [Phalaenopsis equestris]